MKKKQTVVRTREKEWNQRLGRGYGDGGGGGGGKRAQVKGQGKENVQSGSVGNSTKIPQIHRFYDNLWPFPIALQMEQTDNLGKKRKNQYFSLFYRLALLTRKIKGILKRTKQLPPLDHYSLRDTVHSLLLSFPPPKKRVSGYSQREQNDEDNSISIQKPFWQTRPRASLWSSDELDHSRWQGSRS